MALCCHLKTLPSRSLNHHFKCNRRPRKRWDSPSSRETREAQTAPKKSPARLQDSRCSSSRRLHFKSRGRAREPIAAPALWPGSRAGAPPRQSPSRDQLPPGCFPASSGAYRAGAQGATSLCCQPPRFPTLSSSLPVVPHPSSLSSRARRGVARSRGTCLVLGEVSGLYAGTCVPSLFCPSSVRGASSARCVQWDPKNAVRLGITLIRAIGDRVSWPRIFCSSHTAVPPGASHLLVTLNKCPVSDAHS